MSQESERYVIGSVLLDSKVLAEVMEVVRPADFSHPLCEHIFGAMVEMFTSGKPVDAITLMEEMRHTPVYQGVVNAGGAVYLFDMQASVPTASNALYHAELVANAATRARLRSALMRGQQLADGDTDADELVEIVANEVLMAGRPAGTVSWVGATIDEFVATLSQPVRYTPTPWPALNALIGGWAPGRMYVVGARPAVGKSVFGIQAALGMAAHGAVALSSLEMTEDEIQARMLANLADVDLGYIQAHNIPSEAIPRLMAAVQELKELTLAIDDRGSISPLDVGSHARALDRRNRMSGAVIDYVQLMGGDSAMRSRQEEVSAMSRQMKLLAKSLDIPVVALSQLNRESENRVGRIPNMSDLRESGSLEQDADVVILLSKKREQDENGQEFDSPNEVLVQVCKNRNGPTGNFTLFLQGEYARLRNPAMQHTYGLATVIPDN